MKDGWTPLYLAVIFGYVYKVQYLIDHGADVLLADEIGWSVMDWANKYCLPGRAICVKNLISKTSENVKEQCYKMTFTIRN